MIFLLLTETSLLKNLRLMDEVGDSIRGVEVRADFWESWPSATDLLQFHHYCEKRNLKTLFTLRRVVDGGLFSASSDQALVFYAKFLALEKEAAILSGYAIAFTYVDLDATLEEENPNVYLQLCHAFQENGSRIICSFHDFRGIPSDLENMMRKTALRGFLPKAAVKVNGTKELLLLIEIADALADVEKILLGMGTAGFCSRVLTRRFGSLLTYASCVPVQRELGHIDPVTLATVYRYYQIDGDTKLFGIIGNPVMHSRSPEIHNGGYDFCGLNALYLPFETDDLEVFFQVAERLQLGGVSVTVPFKQQIIPLLQSMEAAVSGIGACNTLVWEPSSQRVGYNTDVEGFLYPLDFLFQGGDSLGGMKKLEVKRAGVIGAGGAARAVVYGLMKQGWDVVIFNRTEENAKVLAADFAHEGCGREEGCRCIGLSLDSLSRYSGEFDLLVQTSSAGMGKLAEIDPSVGYEYSGKEIAYDLVYVPEETQFLKRAKETGCRTIGGLAMLQSQAERQFELFTKGYHLSGQNREL